MKNSELADLHARAYDFAAGLKAALATLEDGPETEDEFTKVVAAHWLAHLNAHLTQYSHDFDLLDEMADDELMASQLRALEMGIETEQLGASLGRDMTQFIRWHREILLREERKEDDVSRRK